MTGSAVAAAAIIVPFALLAVPLLTLVWCGRRLSRGRPGRVTHRQELEVDLRQAMRLVSVGSAGEGPLPSGDLAMSVRDDPSDRDDRAR